jgi:hypothetical protein
MKMADEPQEKQLQQLPLSFDALEVALQQTSSGGSAMVLLQCSLPESALWKQSKSPEEESQGYPSSACLHH